MSLSRLAVNRPITTAMLLISVLILGGIAIKRLPLAYLPEVDVPFIGVEVPYPSSNPKEIEREIVKPVEEVLSTLTGVTTLNAEATSDMASFRVEFDWGSELDIARMQVSERWIRSNPSFRLGSATSSYFRSTPMTFRLCRHGFQHRVLICRRVTT